MNGILGNNQGKIKNLEDTIDKQSLQIKILEQSNEIMKHEMEALKCYYLALRKEINFINRINNRDNVKNISVEK